MKRFLAILAALAVITPASAANLAPAPAVMPVKAAVVAVPACSVAGCTGFHFDVNIYNSGTGLNVLNLGQLNANGTSFAVGGGYQYYDGQYWFGARADIGYDMTGGQFGLSNLVGTQVVELGGNLFSALGVAPPAQTGPLSMLTSGIPTADVGIHERGSAVGLAAGATLHYLVAPKFELKGGYLNVNYGTTNIAPGTNMNVENIVWLGGAYHF